MKRTASERTLTVDFLDRPRAWRGRLISGEGPGTEVRAGSFLRKRHITLDLELLESPAALAHIVTHELFHFVWRRLGNRARRSWEDLLAKELRQGTPGELGWSSESRKLRLTREDWLRRTRRWREYACESFCDTAAWLYCRGTNAGRGLLNREARRARRKWFFSCRELKRCSV